MPKQVGVDPVATDVTHGRDMDPGPGVNGVDRALDVLTVPHDEGELVPGASPGHGDVAGKEGGVAGLVDHGGGLWAGRGLVVAGRLLRVALVRC